MFGEMNACVAAMNKQHNAEAMGIIEMGFILIAGALLGWLIDIF